MMSSSLARRGGITVTTMMVLAMLFPLLSSSLLARSLDESRGNVMVADAFLFQTPSSAASLSSIPAGPSPTSTSTSTSTTSTTRLFCICVNCKWVTSCKAYHFVETKHAQPHMSEVPTFLPREGSPTINVNIRTEQRKPKPGAGVVDKTGGMWKEELLNHQNDDDDDGNDDDDDPPRRDASYYENTGTVEAVRTNTTTTIEYDVVKCADFVLDKGCWVRNMPDEIRRVNPDFVPT